MSRRRLTIVTDEVNRTLVLSGWNAQRLAHEAGCRPIYSGSAGGWMLDLSRLSTLCAYFDHRRVAYALSTEDQLANALASCASVAVNNPDQHHDGHLDRDPGGEPDRDPDLFGGAA